MPEPVALEVHGPVRATTLAWHQRGVFALTVIARGTHGSAGAKEPAPIPSDDLPYPHHPGFVRDPEDRAPYRDAAEVMVEGIAMGPTRLTVLRRGEPILDKRFQATTGTPSGGLGGVPRLARQRLLGGLAVPPPGPVLYLSDDFPRVFYQAVTPDQRLASLEPGDAIRVEGFGSRISLTVPTETPTVHASLDGMRVEVAMRCDRVVIDAARKSLHATWRGALTIPDEASYARVAVAVAYEPRERDDASIGATAAHDGSQAPAAGPMFMRKRPPSSRQPQPAPLPPKAAPTEPMREDLTGTLAASAEQVEAALTAVPFAEDRLRAMARQAVAEGGPAFDGEGTVALSHDAASDGPVVPFVGGAPPPSRPRGEPKGIPGAPWAGPSSQPAPVAPGSALLGTMGVGDPSPPAQPPEVKPPEPPAAPPPPAPPPEPKPAPPPHEPPPPEVSPSSKPKERVIAAEPSAPPSKPREPVREPPPKAPDPPKRSRPNLKTALRKKFGR